MTTETNNPSLQQSSEFEQFRVSPHRVEAKSWRFDAFFKVLSYILYGFLFGLFPASFKFAKMPFATPNAVEVSGIMAVMGVTILSIVLIFWIFKGDIRQHLRSGYWFLHIFNALLLTVGVLTISFFPIGGATAAEQANTNQNILMRQAILLATTMGHVFLLAITIGVLFSRYKKLFPLTWSRIGFTQAALILAGTTNVLIWLAAGAQLNSEPNIKEMLLIAALTVYVLAFILFIFALAYIRIYRDILLGERTDAEIETIQNWESAKTMALIASATAAVTFIVASYWDKVFATGLLLWVEVAIDAFLLLSYLLPVLIVRLRERNQTIKATSKIFRVFKSIDNVFLVEVLIWLVLAKAAIIEGVFITTFEQNQAIEPSQIAILYLVALVAFVTVVLLAIINPLLGIITPNIKNMWLSIITVCAAFLLVVLTIVFTTLFSPSANDNPAYLAPFMLLILLTGLSIALIIRIVMMGQIFRRTAAVTPTLDEAAVMVNGTDSSYNVNL